MSITTYHCPCTTLILTTTHNLSTLPHRSSPALDQAIILPLSQPTLTQPSPTTSLTNLTPTSPVTIRRSDGFEKRILHKCARCRVVIGYELVEKKDVLYILPGWLMTTEAMRTGERVDDKVVGLGRGEGEGVAVFT